MTSLLDTRRVFVMIFAIGLFAMAARNVTDPDVWWHLRTGQLILQNHAVFHSDPYSFTKFGQPWVNHEWLSDVIIFVVYRTAGWAGLIVVFAAIVSTAFMCALSALFGSSLLGSGGYRFGRDCIVSVVGCSSSNILLAFCKPVSSDS